MSRQAHNRQTALAARQQFGVARSGATIEVVDESGNLVVRKWSPTRAANKGFHLQQNKQKNFLAEQDRYPGISAPRIRDNQTSGMTHFDMDYVSFLPVSEQMIAWSPDSVSRFVKRLWSFIDTNIEARRTSVSTGRIVSKMDQIIQRTRQSDTLSKYAISLVEQRKSAIPSTIEVPAGYEHGDLTFSNILASDDGDELVLIDFTISPVETPLQDIAKLLQELVFRWSWRDKRMTNQEMARLDANLRFIKAGICDAFVDTYAEAMSLLTFLTIARILPYAQSARDVAWIVDALHQLETDNLG